MGNVSRCGPLIRNKKCRGNVPPNLVRGKIIFGLCLYLKLKRPFLSLHFLSLFFLIFFCWCPDHNYNIAQNFEMNATIASYPHLAVPREKLIGTKDPPPYDASALPIPSKHVISVRVLYQTRKNSKGKRENV